MPSPRRVACPGRAHASVSCSASCRASTRPLLPAARCVRSSRARRRLMTQEPDSARSSLPGPREAAAGAGETAAASVVPDDLHALRAVVEGTAAGTGREFFRSLVRHLAEAIDVHYAAVCEILGPSGGRVLAVWERDHVVENVDFDFTISPAAEILSG